MIRTLVFTALLVPGLAFAAGGGGSSAPKTTNTTKSCSGGKVWDNASKSCKTPSYSGFSEDTLYQAARELAYDGQYRNAQTVLAAMTDQNDDRVLTYWGFTHRKMGDVDKGMAYYNKALARNPSNILARSYMGQALVLEGDVDAARAQLLAIRDHGGAGTWAETALLTAIESGKTYDY
ncbi:MAG: tetratricopeptide repeat protein [Pseudomonadota bacterium]